MRAQVGVTFVQLKNKPIKMNQILPQMPLLGSKLRAIEYPQSEEFDVYNQRHVRLLMIWLEDSKIKHYPENQRDPLRDIDNHSWDTAFFDYIQSLGCPYPTPPPSPEAVVDWVLSHAINLEYHNEGPRHDGDDVVDTFAARLAEIDLCRIAGSLGVEFNEVGTIDVLRNIEAIVQRRAASIKGSVPGIATDLSNVEAYPLGFSTGDAALDRAATVLRLLYIADMRELQFAVNDLTVEMQLLTANPSTDSKLGKVGK